MSKPKGIVVCVGYDDLLEITLKRNMRHLAECCVITSHDDAATHSVCSSTPGVVLFKTDAFTRHGAIFNKGLAIEEGLDFFGRSGWILIWDSDVLFPDTMDLSAVSEGCLYGASRRIVNDPRDYHDGCSFMDYPLTIETEFAGFFQLFCAADSVLNERPWYDPTFIHAGGSDSFFQAKWTEPCRIRLPIEVLHLGPRDTNWFGRASIRMDGSFIQNSRKTSRMMHALKLSNKWIKSLSRHRKFSLKDRVKIPGFKSTFLWFNSNPETDNIDDSK